MKCYKYVKQPKTKSILFVKDCYTILYPVLGLPMSCDDLGFFLFHSRIQSACLSNENTVIHA
jgi:hypothetical protein